MVIRVSMEVPRPKPEGLQAPDFWPRDFPRGSIHHDTPKALPYIFIPLSSWTRKEEFYFTNGLPREYNVQCYIAEVQTLVV